ncbi:hypothetical protein ABKN59_011217 [Abortiporus biennis]
MSGRYHSNSKAVNSTVWDGILWFQVCIQRILKDEDRVHEVRSAELATRRENVTRSTDKSNIFGWDGTLWCD